MTLIFRGRMDSMLGALALGDIGKHFPDTDERYKGADSMKLLKCVNDLINEKGYEITINSNVKDKVIIAGATLKDNVLVTSGGRVLSLLGYGLDRYEAIKNAYDILDKVNFSGKYCRLDIGK